MKLLIIGLDAAVPDLVFEQWRDRLPNLNNLIQSGCYGNLTSCIPAITMPAWTCMMSGRDPGELGIYGFRNRVDRSYTKMAIANSDKIKVPRLWNLLGDAGWQVAVLGVPGTFPPQIVNGALVSCFLTPGFTSDFTYPLGLKAQIAALQTQSSNDLNFNSLNISPADRIDTSTITPDQDQATAIENNYLFDVPNFRANDKNRILRDIYRLGNQTFNLATYLKQNQQPDLMMLVDMGIDRIQHAFWKYMDPRHPLHEPDSTFADAIVNYYAHVDRQIGNLLAQCEPDTAVLVVSDHGAQPLMGGFALNQWLHQEGYLVFKNAVTKPTSLDRVAVDWAKTKAWGAGGYYGRVFMNVQGREPQGVIPLAEYQQERQKLAQKLAAIKDPQGNLLGVTAHLPQQLYKRVRGIAPDLIVYFQDLAWRSLGTVGVDSLYALENDTGPDDANHAQDGIMIFYDPTRPMGGKRLEGMEIYDVLPTLLSRYGIPMPTGLRGKVWDW
ncbi:type I phosphodiesterase/nucleotide pyrophosphatase [Thalassoporum mexicanum PCC 7367]|uniref:alkaline phosphatase family protein n=1 Tax=Thalassoporum mexicanum TaxID=3457544 RepID=UPI00029F90A7|nr:alkaline phosphatase family protein [Pseudanabaena sp. PCC 7367]AFY68995.1 type I phosphodiesterase/nucleotide pyrophosphatase [Pseudanabaena sp. PCC 7367]